MLNTSAILILPYHVCVTKLLFYVPSSFLPSTLCYVSLFIFSHVRRAVRTARLRRWHYILLLTLYITKEKDPARCPYGFAPVRANHVSEKKSKAYFVYYILLLIRVP